MSSPLMYLRLRLPDTCPECRVTGLVRPETTIHGQTVTLTWCCTNCGYEWPIAPEDEERAED
jgi:hypothetical protein